MIKNVFNVKVDVHFEWNKEDGVWEISLLGKNSGNFHPKENMIWGNCEDFEDTVMSLLQTAVEKRFNPTTPPDLNTDY